MKFNYIVGQDAIDIAKLAGVYMNRDTDRVTDNPVYSWSVAEQLINEGAKAEEFFLDLARFTPEQTVDVVQSLVGLWKLGHEYCITFVA